MAVDMFLKLGDINGESKSAYGVDPVGDLLVYSYGDDADGAHADAVPQDSFSINFARIELEPLGESPDGIGAEADAAADLSGGMVWSIETGDFG